MHAITIVVFTINNLSEVKTNFSEHEHYQGTYKPRLSFWLWLLADYEESNNYNEEAEDEEEDEWMGTI